jgi:hypothetical protein
MKTNDFRRIAYPFVSAARYETTRALPLERLAGAGVVFRPVFPARLDQTLA